MIRRDFLKSTAVALCAAVVGVPDVPKTYGRGVVKSTELDVEKLRLAKTLLDSHTDISYVPHHTAWLGQTHFSVGGEDYYFAEYYTTKEEAEARHHGRARKAMREALKHSPPASWSLSKWPVDG